MTEKQMRKLLAEQLAEQTAVLKADIKTDINIEMAKFFGQMVRHTDSQVASLRSEMHERFDMMYTLMDGLAKRITDDEQERTGLEHEQNRHKKWIGQIAKHSRTKLVPELQ